MEVQQNSQEFNLFSILQWSKSLLPACCELLAGNCACVILTEFQTPSWYFQSAIPARHASKARRAGEIPNPKSTISNLPLSPLQFVSENGEVVFLARLYQKEGPISLFDGD